MEYFRKYLILIRRFSNMDMKPHFLIRLIGIVLIGIIGGIIIDILLPFTFILNLLRSAIALITGISLGSYFFVLYNRKKNTRQQEDKYYVPLRKRFSFRQRANISIILGVLLTLLILLSNKNNIVYTLKTSISISIFFLLVSFARRDRNEFLKEIYDIPDLRDLEFQSNKVKKTKESTESEDKKEASEPKKAKNMKK